MNQKFSTRVIAALRKNSKLGLAEIRPQQSRIPPYKITAVHDS